MSGAYMTPTGYWVHTVTATLHPVELVGWFALEDWMPVLEAFYIRIRGEEMQNMPKFIAELEANFDEFPMEFEQDGQNVKAKHKQHYGMVRTLAQIPPGKRIVRPWLPKSHFVANAPETLQ